MNKIFIFLIVGSFLINCAPYIEYTEQRFQLLNPITDNCDMKYLNIEKNASFTDAFLQVGWIKVRGEFQDIDTNIAKELKRRACQMGGTTLSLMQSASNENGSVQMFYVLIPKFNTDDVQPKDTTNKTKM